MLYTYHDPKTDGLLKLVCQDSLVCQQLFSDRHKRLLTIAWNMGESQMIMIDELPYLFPRQSVLPLMMNQTVLAEQPDTIVAWHFDREFYCIVDHDQEVSCAGFLFYGAKIPMFIQLDESEQAKFEALLMVFDDEFATCDTIQGEMLRMLLKRLIIKLTRLAKHQYLTHPLTDREVDLVRRFNLLLEINFRTLHSVSDYAALLNKSPKTLSNVFALYNQQSPLQVIHKRIIQEAKRLLLYTEKSTKEIAFTLGFEEVPHFSRFFKKQTGQSPSEFKEKARLAVADFGKN